MSSGDIDMVELLLQHGAIPEIAYGYFGNILHTAAYLGYLHIVKGILDAKMGIDINEPNDKFRLTSLGMLMEYEYKVLDQDPRVAEGDRVEIMRMLVEAGATVTEAQRDIWKGIAAKAGRFAFMTRSWKKT